jgi:hypothetical protein
MGSFGRKKSGLNWSLLNKKERYEVDCAKNGCIGGREIDIKNS